MVSKSSPQTLRWAKLREGFLSAIAASKGMNKVRSYNGCEVLRANSSTSNTKYKQFEGFKLFPREERAWIPTIRYLVRQTDDGSNVKATALSWMNRLRCRELRLECLALVEDADHCVVVCRKLLGDEKEEGLGGVACKDELLLFEGASGEVVGTVNSGTGRLAIPCATLKFSYTSDGSGAQETAGIGERTVAEDGIRLVTYNLPNGAKVVTRELSNPESETTQPRVTVTLEQLFSHRVHGVDNTGNIRVWPAEQALLHVLLSDAFAPLLRGARILELGAGMSGLAGLGVAVCSEARAVVVTDGNPEAVENLEACVALNASVGSFGATQVSARRLLWDRMDRDGSRADLLSDFDGRFDLIIASDCLFFKDFHEELIGTIAGLLAPHGRAVLVQPQRGGTASLFVKRVLDGLHVDRHCSGALDARLVERYDARLWAMHQRHLRARDAADGSVQGYLADRHLPLLVELVMRDRDGSKGTQASRQRPSVDPRVGRVDGNNWTVFPAIEIVLGWKAGRSPTCNTESPVARTSPRGQAEGVGQTLEIGETTKTTPRLSSTPLSPSATSRGQGQDPQERYDRNMCSVYDELAARLRTRLRGEKQEKGAAGHDQDGGSTGKLWLAIAGAPGSGKTTLAAEVCKRVSEEFPTVCVPMDGFHFYRRELDAMPNREEAYRRRGAHWTFDGKRFLAEIETAKRAGRGSFPRFDHAVGDPVEDEIKVEPWHDLVIVEGNYLLLRDVDPWDGASELFDETWAIRCLPETCGERVRKRHIETGMSEQEARARVDDNDLPNARFVQDVCPWDEVGLVIDSK